MYKIKNGLVEVPQEYHPVPRLQNSARGHPRQFQRFQPTVDAFKYAFLPRTIPTWNALPQAVAEAGSLDIFKRHMSRHQQFWSSASCTMYMYIVHTCSTAHSFIAGFNLRTCFAVADHRGQDPASSVLSFEGRCYLSIQIQIQILSCLWCEQNWRQVKTVFSSPHHISRLNETVSKINTVDNTLLCFALTSGNKPFSLLVQLYPCFIR